MNSVFRQTKLYSDWNGQILQRMVRNPKQFCGRKFSSYQVNSDDFMFAVGYCLAWHEKQQQIKKSTKKKKNIQPTSKPHILLMTTYREPISMALSDIHQMCNKNLKRRSQRVRNACGQCQWYHGGGKGSGSGNRNKTPRLRHESHASQLLKQNKKSSSSGGDILNSPYLASWFGDNKDSHGNSVSKSNEVLRRLVKKKKAQEATKNKNNTITTNTTTTTTTTINSATTDNLKDYNDVWEGMVDVTQRQWTNIFEVARYREYFVPSSNNNTTGIVDESAVVSTDRDETNVRHPVLPVEAAAALRGVVTVETHRINDLLARWHPQRFNSTRTRGVSKNTERNSKCNFGFPSSLMKRLAPSHERYRQLLTGY